MLIVKDVCALFEHTIKGVYDCGFCQRSYTSPFNIV